MGNRRPTRGRPGSPAKRRRSTAAASGRSHVRRRAGVSQAEMRKLATRELLRRAALATPVLGGLLILGLLAVSMMRGPNRPDTVVGATTTVSGNLDAAAGDDAGSDADSDSDEVAVGAVADDTDDAADTVTTGADDDADAADLGGHHPHDGRSGPTSTGPDGDEDASATPDAPTKPDAPDEGAGAGHGQPTVGQPDQSPDTHDGGRVDGHDSGSRDDRRSEPDDDDIVSVGIGPVAAAIGGPGPVGAPAPHHDGDHHTSSPDRTGPSSHTAPPAPTGHADPTSATDHRGHTSPTGPGHEPATDAMDAAGHDGRVALPTPVVIVPIVVPSPGPSTVPPPSVAVRDTDNDVTPAPADDSDDAVAPPEALTPARDVVAESGVDAADDIEASMTERVVRPSHDAVEEAPEAVEEAPEVAAPPDDQAAPTVVKAGTEEPVAPSAVEEVAAAAVPRAEAGQDPTARGSEEAPL